MAHYAATVSSSRSPDEVFQYLADFRSVADWDPSITESAHVNGDDPVTEGAVFRVTTKTRLSRIVLNYTTLELNRPRRIVLRGENDTMISLDTITIEPSPEGSAVTYDAELELKGLRKLADPLLDFGFQRLGDRARDGLARALNDGPPSG